MERCRKLPPSPRTPFPWACRIFIGRITVYCRFECPRSVAPLS
jgi:hypothetical protein